MNNSQRRAGGKRATEPGRREETYREDAYREDAVATLEAHSDAVIKEVQRLAALAGIAVPRVASGTATPAVLRIVEEPGSEVKVRARFHPVYTQYFAAGSVVIALPEQAADLLELLVAAGSTRRGTIIGVLPAHGGAGASMLSSWLARHLSQEDSTGLIDLDPLSLGLAEDLGLAGDAGLRWADLNEDAGALVPGRLNAALPHLGDLRVLSADDRGAVPPSGESGERAISALSQVHKTTVLDLPRGAGLGHGISRGWLEWCDVVVIVSHPTSRGLEQCHRILAALPSHHKGIVVANGANGGSQAAALALELGHSQVFALHRLRNMQQDLEHGVRLGDRQRSTTAREVGRIAAACQEGA
ncbi:MAG: hypothetical protein ACTHW1_05350 [Ancrocorticia sp.]|uniref:hypothetical protein n=1 Tax=Ancrocorticia sp. TaxID=2593684 RepID=UPI003F8FB332